MDIILKDVNKDNIFFQQPVKNSVIDNSTFKGIIYSTSIMTLNSICLEIQATIRFFNKVYDKTKIYIDSNKNIADIEKLENDILDRCAIENKIRLVAIKNTLNSKVIKLISSKTPKSIILKISGVWESNTHYGLTYKFVNYSPVGGEIF